MKSIIFSVHLKHLKYVILSLRISLFGTYPVYKNFPLSIVTSEDCILLAVKKMYLYKKKELDMSESRKL